MDLNIQNRNADQMTWPRLLGEESQHGSRDGNTGSLTGNKLLLTAFLISSMYREPFFTTRAFGIHEKMVKVVTQLILVADENAPIL